MPSFAAVVLSIALALVPILPAAASEQGWTVAPAPSDHPDLRAATVANADGHRLYVWELIDEESSQIYCEMHLAKGLRFADAMPTYSIDGGAPVDTADIRDAGEAQNALWGHVGESVAFWLLSPPRGSAGGADDPLAPWLGGREVEISFHTADGHEQTTRFSLDGSAEAIRNATGIVQN